MSGSPGRGLQPNQPQQIPVLNAPGAGGGGNGISQGYQPIYGQRSMIPTTSFGHPTQNRIPSGYPDYPPLEPQASRRPETDFPNRNVPGAGGGNGNPQGSQLIYEQRSMIPTTSSGNSPQNRNRNSRANSNYVQTRDPRTGVIPEIYNPSRNALGGDGNGNLQSSQPIYGQRSMIPTASFGYPPQNQNRIPRGHPNCPPLHLQTGGIPETGIPDPDAPKPVLLEHSIFPRYGTVVVGPVLPTPLQHRTIPGLIRLSPPYDEYEEREPVPGHPYLGQRSILAQPTTRFGDDGDGTSSSFLPTQAPLLLRVPNENNNRLGYVMMHRQMQTLCISLSGRGGGGDGVGVNRQFLSTSHSTARPNVQAPRNTRPMSGNSSGNSSRNDAMVRTGLPPNNTHGPTLVERVVPYEIICINCRADQQVERVDASTQTEP